MELIELAFNENLAPVKYILTDKNKLKPLADVENSAITVASLQQGDIQEIGKKLLIVAANGDLDELRSILTKKIPFYSDWLGTSPLHLAAQNNNVEICKLLLEAGISKDAQNKLEKTPLHLACYEGHSDVVQVLLDYNVDINCKDMLSMTPLHWAVQRKHGLIVRKLLARGADISVINKFNLSAQDIAKQMKVDKIERLLEEYKTKRNFELSNDILEPTDVTQGTFSAVKLLEEHGITMLTNDLDEQDILNCAVESGHSVILTDVGKQLLHTVKQEEKRKILELPSKRIKHVTVAPEQFLTTSEDLNKPKLKVTSPDPPSGIKKRFIQSKSNSRNADVEFLKKQLLEARRTIEFYKTKLRKKEIEAENYKKKLKFLTNSNFN